MPKINIKLGRTWEDDMPSKEDFKEKEHFPSFHIESDEKLDLPHEGTMTIRFKKTGFSMREDDDGDATYSCDVEVREIIDAYGDEPERPTRSLTKGTEDALAGLKADRKKRSDYY